MGKYSKLKYVGIQEAGIGFADPILTDSTSLNLEKSKRYIITSPTSCTMTLPPSPAIGDKVGVVISNNLLTNTINRNGQRIQGLNENLTLDVSNVSIELLYTNSILGWRLV